MSNYTSSFANGSAVDALLTTVSGSNLSADHKITRSATLVVAASNSSAKGKAQADYVCDGTADNVEIQAAIDALQSGGLLQFLEGTYAIASHVTKQGNDLNIEGIGDVIFNINTGSQDPAFFFNGSTITTQSLSADSASGTMTVTLANASSVQIGDIIDIHNNVLWSSVDFPTLVTGEIYLVSGVSGNVVTLNQPLMRAYNTADSSAATIYRPIKVNIENIQFNNHSAIENLIGLQVEICKESSVHGCTFENHGLTALRLEKCYDFSIEKCTIRNSNVAGYGYGICISGASGCVRVENNYIENCRHAITSTTEDHISLNRAIIITDNVFVGSHVNTTDGNIVDSHPCTIDYTVVNNVFYPYTGLLSFLDGSHTSTFANNTVYGNAVARRGVVSGGVHTITNNRVDGGYLYLGVGAGVGKSISITSNFVQNCNYGIRSPTESYEQYIVSGNTISTCTNDAIDIILTNTATSSAEAVITGNNISGCQQNGIFTYCSSATYKLYNKINNNIVKNVNLNGGYYYGIEVMNSDHGDVSYNTVINDTGEVYKAIYEAQNSGTSDYNVIKGNIISGATIAVSRLGTHTIVSNNLGYVTENTGTATITAASTSVNVSHGLSATPTRVIISPTTATAGKQYYVSAKAASTFTITIDSAAEADISFDWQAVI